MIFLSQVTWTEPQYRSARARQKSATRNPAQKLHYRQDKSLYDPKLSVDSESALRFDLATRNRELEAKTGRWRKSFFCKGGKVFFGCQLRLRGWHCRLRSFGCSHEPPHRNTNTNTRIMLRPKPHFQGQRSLAQYSETRRTGKHIDGVGMDGPLAILDNHDFRRVIAGFEHFPVLQ